MPRRSRPQIRRARPIVEALEAKQLLTAFLVTSTADSGPGTLRQAILDVNADPASVTGPFYASDLINFAIPGSGVQTIAPLTPLPAIIRPVDIDATTQPGYTGAPLVVLDGVNTVDPANKPVVGLDFSINNNVSGTGVHGLGIVRFSGTALEVDASVAQIANVVIGTDHAGGQNLGNGGYGIKFGAFGTGSVANSVIENSALRAIGTSDDYPGQPMNGTGVTADRGVTTANLTEANNDTATTELLVTTTGGAAVTLNGVYGSTATLTYVVTNTGSLAATDATVALVENAFYPFLKILSATSTASDTKFDLTTRDGDSGYPAFASLGTVAPGASVTLTIQAQIGSGTETQEALGQLTALANSPQVDYNPFRASGLYDINASTTTATPADSLVIATPTGTYDDYYVAFGSVQPLVYTVTNTGTTDATNVAVSFHAGVPPLLVSTISATTTQGTLSPNFSIDSDTNNVASIGTLAPGASATVTIMVQVATQSVGTYNDEIINAVVGSDQSPSSSSALYTLTANETGQNPTPTPGPTPTPTTPVIVSPITTPTSSPTPTPSPTPTSSPTPTTVIVPTPILTPTPTLAPADLVISGTAPTLSHAGSASLFLLTIHNAGGTAATDAVAALNLAAIPAGSFYSILSQGSTGAAGKVTPMPGRPGIYLVDLGSIAAGASAVVDLLVIPKSSGPMSLALAASDAADPTLDPTPGNNVAYLGTTTAPAVATVSAPTLSTLQLDFSSALTRADAEDVSHYQLTTTTGTTVAIRSATYNAIHHRVTLRLAQPIPTTASGAQLTITGLGSTSTSDHIPISTSRKRR